MEILGSNATVEMQTGRRRTELIKLNMALK